MKKYLRISLFLTTISIFVLLNTTVFNAYSNSENKQKIITQEQAATLASKIANEKFQSVFGISPFTPESYTAELVDNKWRWGKIDPAAINGCSAIVTFNKDGSHKNVKVAFHTDENLETQQESIKIEMEAEKVIPNIEDRKEE
jgi:hypothetical protein